MGNCTYHEHLLDRREVSHNVQDKVQVKHSSSLTQQVVSKLSTALLKAEVPLVQEKWAT